MLLIEEHILIDCSAHGGVETCACSIRIYIQEEFNVTTHNRPERQNMTKLVQAVHAKFGEKIVKPKTLNGFILNLLMENKIPYSHHSHGFIAIPAF